MMARRKWLAATCAAVCIVSLAAGSSGAATMMGNLHLKHTDAFTELSIPLPSHLLCEHFTLPPSGDKPFRVVLDFCETQHALPKQLYADLPVSVVQQIRTSQYATAPQPIVRIVLDLKDAATYTIRTESDAVVVAIADRGRPAFAEWEANPGEMPVSRPPQILADDRPNVQPTTVDKQVAVPERTTAPSRSEPTVARVPRSEKGTPAKPEVARQPAPDVSTSPASTTPATVARTEQSHPEPETLTQRHATATPIRQSAATAKSGAPTPAAPLVLADDTPARPVRGSAPSTPTQVRESEPQHTSEIAVTTEPVTESETPAASPTTAAPFVLPDRPLVLAPEYIDLGTKAAVAAQSDPRLAAGSPADLLMGTQHAGTPPATDGFAVTPDDPNLWASVDAPAGEGMPTHVVTDPQEQSLIERLKTKFFSDKPAPRPYTTTSIDPSVTPFGPPSPGGAGVLDRRQLLERIRLAEEEATRYDGQPAVPPDGRGFAEVQYNDMGRRDPFQPLLGGLRSGFVTDALPNVENLRMVGVLHDDYDAMALLEDMEGHSYILRAGDAVENGHVVAVQDTRVLFQVDDYGWMRTVALQLSPRGSDPTKALGFNTVHETTDSGNEEGNDNKKNGE